MVGVVLSVLRAFARFFGKAEGSKHLRTGFYLSRSIRKPNMQEAV